MKGDEAGIHGGADSSFGGIGTRPEATGDVYWEYGHERSS